MKKQIQELRAILGEAGDILKPKSKYRTNGDITNHLLKAAATDPPPAELERFAERLLNMFPLSSHKMLYDVDLAKLSPHSRTALLNAAKKTDAAKKKRAIDQQIQLGVPKAEAEARMKNFGRA